MKTKDYYLRLTEGEMDILGLMLENERGVAKYKYKKDDYGYHEELKSLWGKVITGVKY